jgi:hypothetical protein
VFYYKKKGVKEVVLKKNSLFSRIFYNMIEAAHEKRTKTPEQLSCHGTELVKHPN